MLFNLALVYKHTTSANKPHAVAVESSVRLGLRSLTLSITLMEFISISTYASSRAEPEGTLLCAPSALIPTATKTSGTLFSHRSQFPSKLVSLVNCTSYTAKLTRNKETLHITRMDKVVKRKLN